MARMMPCCASSTWVSRTGPRISISSTRFSAARSEMLPVILVAHLLGDALEREREVGGVDLAQHQLHRAVVDLHDVLEHEHPALHAPLGDTGVEGLEALHDLALGGAVGAVDDGDQSVDAAQRDMSAGWSIEELRSSVFDQRYDLGRRTVDHRDPVGDLGVRAGGARRAPSRPLAVMWASTSESPAGARRR